MASNPPGQCCTIGVKHEGKPKGEIKDIGKSKKRPHLELMDRTLTTAAVSTYFSYPEDKQTANAILILPDVHGHEFSNAQLSILPNVP